MAEATTHQRFCFIFFFFFVCSVFPMMFHAKEIELLLSFKASINGDPSGFLANWNYSSPNFCLWNGVSCDNTSTHVTSIDLSAKNISGKVSWDIFRLPFVESVNLSGNQLYGGIPSNIFSASVSLRHLNLSSNNFTGQVAVGGFVSGIQTLDLSSNMLTGKIPSGIGNFSGLKYIDLGGNMLFGEIPPSISNMTMLEFLTLASNQLAGRIPPGIGRLKKLKWIYLGYNNFSGEIPEEIGELSSLFHLDVVYNNLTGKIPPSLGNLTHLQNLFLYQNKLNGLIPEAIYSLRDLVSLDLSDNNLSGEISEKISQLQNLQVLQLFSNNFSGKIPNGVASLPHLQVLQLWKNRFLGEIPQDLGRRNNITILDLSTNSLTGNIPAGLCDSGVLFKLILFSNQLHGEIPDRLSACTSLQRVRLQNNSLSGTLPAEFTRLPLVYFLDISNNNLSGKIGEQRWEMASLQMLNLAGNGFSGRLPESFGSERIENIDLSGNQFSGQIPEEFGKFSDMVQLDLGLNQLTGEIPRELCKCKKLVTLNLSRNKLGGEIPLCLAEMPVLSLLDLSANELTGEIPANLGKVEALVELNLSYNHLRGSLPLTGVFLAINASSVFGNSLCGGHKSSGLPECRKTKLNSFWLFFSACFLAGMLVICLTGFIIVIVRRRTNFDAVTRVERGEGIWEFRFFDSKFAKSIAMEDVFQSISRGKIGNTDEVNCTSNGVQFVLTKLKTIGASVPSDFWPEMSELRKIDHRNIVRLLGIFRSEKNIYLMYEYVEGIILREIIRNMTWERHRKIATGIARALNFLHFQSVVIGDLSPEKVVVDRNGEPRLRLIVPGHVHVNRKHVAASAYVAPETRESKEITEKADIYALGLILIELLTGKSPGNAEFGVAHRSFVDWARYCYSDCHLDTWVDPMIRTDTDNHYNQIVEIMNLALQCTASDPSARPSAAEVSKTLETTLRVTSFCISGLNFSSSPF